MRDHGIHQLLTEWWICLERATYGGKIQAWAKREQEKAPVREARLLMHTPDRTPTSGTGQPHSFTSMHSLPLCYLHGRKDHQGADSWEPSGWCTCSTFCLRSQGAGKPMPI